MSKRLALVASMFVASIFSIGVAVAKSGHRDTLPDRFLRETRGGSAMAGKCSVTCEQWQAISDNSGNWSCAGDADGTPCSTCSANGTVTYPDQTTGDSGACPGSFFTQGNPQDCGKESAPFSGTCSGGVCTGTTDSLTLNCNDPKEAVKQAGH